MGALKPRALWSHGGAQLSDHVRWFSTSLLVGEPLTSAWPVAGWPAKGTDAEEFAPQLSWYAALLWIHYTSKSCFCNHQDGRKLGPAAPVENWHTALPLGAGTEPRFRNTNLGCPTSAKELSLYWACWASKGPVCLEFLRDQVKARRIHRTEAFTA